MRANTQEVLDGYAKFLNPLTLRANLLIASIFLVAYESLMQCIVEQLQDFYLTGFNSEGFTYSDSYKTKVLDRHKERLTASLLWFQESGAIDQADIDLVDRIRKHRNDIAHELSKFVTAANHEIDIELLEGLLRVVTKVDQWWIREVEIPINPDLHDKEIDYEAVQSGRMMFLSMLLRIAAGDDESSMELYSKFREATGKPVPVAS